MVEATQQIADELGGAEGVSANLVARTVGLLITMANQLGQPMAEQAVLELMQRATEVTEELMALVDPDDLATYIADQGAAGGPALDQ